MATNPLQVNEIASVVVPVTDQDRALAFYRDTLGFVTRQDAAPGGEFRWLEVAPEGSGTTLALVPPRGGMWQQVGIDTRIILVSDDLAADHRMLHERGVDADAEILRLGPGVPAMFRFRDPDGNTLQVVERSA